MPTSFLTAYNFAATYGPTTVAPQQRLLEDRLDQIVNVKNFGAKGDGTTDDTDAIYNAVRHVYSSAALWVGGIVFFPPGTYRVNSAPIQIGPVFFFYTTNSGTSNTANFSWVPSGLPIGMVCVTNPNAASPFGGTTVAGSTSGASGSITFSASRTFTAGQEVALVLPPGGQVGNITLRGAGRDASIIRGSNSTTFLVQVRDASSGGYCNGLHDLTVWNESTNSNSGGFADFTNMNNWIKHSDCTFIGYTACHLGWETFGIGVRSCNLYCSSFVSTASTTGRPPAPVMPTADHGASVVPSGSIGLLFGEGEVTNCIAIGFDIGYALSQNVITFAGNRASRCNTGINLGQTWNPQGHFFKFGSVPSVYANLLDRCGVGIVEYASQPGVRISNLVCGNLSNNIAAGTPAGAFSDCVLEPATISNIVPGTPTVVTTTVPHGMGTSGSAIVELITTPKSLTPDGTGNQIITATLTGASTFTYTGGSGTFSSGTWNIGSTANVWGAAFLNTSYMSNILTLRCNYGSFVLQDVQDGTASGSMRSNFVCATQGPYGWGLTNTSNDPNYMSRSQFTYVMCGLPASSSLSMSPTTYALANPLATLMTMSGLVGADSDQSEGKEVNVVDGVKVGGGAATFGDSVTGGGSGHYKVRYNGTNWIRIG